MCVIKFFALSLPLESVLNIMSRPRACCLMSCAMERMLWKFRGSSCLRVIYMTTTEYGGGKLLKFVSSLNFFNYVAAQCHFTFRGFHCVYIQWGLLGLSNASALRTTSDASGGCVSQFDSETEYQMKLHSIQVITDGTSYYGCKGLCSSKCHHTVWS